jgi:hypothetical protein
VAIKAAKNKDTWQQYKVIAYWCFLLILAGFGSVIWSIAIYLFSLKMENPNEKNFYWSAFGTAIWMVCYGLVL